MTTVTLHVVEATEGKQIQSLESMLTSINGVERALVDVEDGEVKIEFDESKITKDDLIDEIEQQGFHLAE